jgi:hypothetical protein
VEEYKYVYPSTDKYRMNIGWEKRDEDERWEGTEEEEKRNR